MTLTLVPSTPGTLSANGGSQPVMVSDPLTLGAADLLAINDTPILHIPGVMGKCIAIVEIQGQYVPGTTPFTDAPALKWSIGPTGQADGGFGWGGYDDLFQGGANPHAPTTLVETLDFDPAVWTNGPTAMADWLGAGIYVTANGNWTDGDGSVVVTALYRLITPA